MNNVFSVVAPFTRNEASFIRCASPPESVEELCDSVALVHQSQKVLDGRISEVKEKFKQNLFEITNISLCFSEKRCQQEYFCV